MTRFPHNEYFNAGYREALQVACSRINHWRAHAAIVQKPHVYKEIDAFCDTLIKELTQREENHK